MYTVLSSRYKNVSKTDIPCSWLKKPKSHMQETQELSQLFPSKKPDYK